MVNLWPSFIPQGETALDRATHLSALTLSRGFR